MNESIGRPKVAGIRLESLLKLSLTKGTDRKTTVIDLVVQMIAGEGGAGEAVLDIGAELKGLEVAARVKSLKAVRRALDDLKGGLEVVEGCKDKVGQRGIEFLSDAAGQVRVVEASMRNCESKVSGLCR